MLASFDIDFIIRSYFMFMYNLFLILLYIQPCFMLYHCLLLMFDNDYYLRDSNLLLLTLNYVTCQF